MFFAWAEVAFATIQGLHGGRLEMTEMGHDRNPTMSNVAFAQL